MRRTILTVLVSLVCGGFISCVTPPPREPGGTADHVQLALQDPDEYAWQIFFFLNRPAARGKAGIADPNQNFGEVTADRQLVWETWALASGGKDSEVFKPDESTPKSWDDLRRTPERRLILDLDRETLLTQGWGNSGSVLKQQAPSKGSKDSVNIFPPNPMDEEVRINRATFDSILATKIYSCGGLDSTLKEARVRCDRRFVQVPTSAKEIKARWIRIDAAQQSRYLWRKDDQGRLWGLAAFHLSTKDIPNWFWADFGHIDCEEGGTPPCGGTKPDDPVNQAKRATLRWDSTTMGPNAKHGSNGVRIETVGTVWQYYRLRGTQTNFIRPWGEPWLLSNPVFEKTMEKSSCMGCHSQAAIGSDPDSEAIKVCKQPLVTTPDAVFSVYIPRPEDYGVPKEIKNLQTDFMWTPIAQRILPPETTPRSR
jgi:hypothetical protein